MESMVDSETKLSNQCQFDRKSKLLESSRRKLTDPSNNKWPVVSEEINTQLQSKLKSCYKHCLRSVKKPPKWKPELPVDSLSEKEEEQKILFRSWFVVGSKNVIKELERNNLRLVLIWKATQPPLLKQTILSMVASRQCAAVSMSDILAAIQESWPGLTSATSIGIKKSNETNDFDDLVEYVKCNVPLIDLPEVSKFDDHAYKEDHHVDSSTNTSRKTDENKTFTSVGETKEILPSKEKGGNATENRTRILPPRVDSTKYYIYKQDKKADKKFDGQDFIAFGEENEMMKIDKGAENVGCISFGITPSLINNALTRNTREVTDGNTIQNVKRNSSQLDSNKSSYKRINIKNLKDDSSSTKAKKTKKRKKLKV